MKRPNNQHSMFQILAILLLAANFVLVGCSGKKAGKTSTKISLGRIITGGADLVDGGVLLIGLDNVTGEKFSTKYDGQSIELRNSTWSFYAMAWQTAPLQGQLRCGLAEGVLLNGGELSVSVSLTTTACTHNFFGSSDSKDSSGAPHPLVFATCANESCFWDEGSNNEIERSPIRGVAKSYQISYPNFNAVAAGEITSPCHTQSLDNVAETTSTLHLPILNFPIPVTIRAYDDVSCAGGFDQYVFNDGIRSQQPFKTWFNTDPVNLQNKIRLMSDVCRVPDVGNNYRYSTTGLPKDIHILCTETQFMSIMTSLGTPSFQDDIYYLGRSLDFAGFSPTVPIGSVAFPFKGAFIGNNNTISNYHLQTSGITSNIGIFGYAFGTISDSVVIADLNIVNSSSESSDPALSNIGVLLGNASQYVILKNISLSNSYIQLPGCTIGSECFNVGGIAGNFSSAAIKAEAYRISVQNFSFKANDTSIVGGIIGKLGVNGSLRDSNINGLTLASTSNMFSIGGIVGEIAGELYDVTSTIAISQTPTFLGSIDSFSPKSTGTNLGALVGTTTGTSSRVQYAKSIGTIDLGTVQFVGGVFGIIYGASNLENIVSDVDITTSNGTFIGGTVGLLTASTSFINLDLIRNFGNISCAQYCGGLFGNLSEGGAVITLSNGHNYGDITGSSTDIGGIAGKYDSTQAGTLLKIIHNEGNITGDSNVGGIIGNRFTNATDGRSKFSLAYNIGDITAANASGIAGGIIGTTDNWNDGEVTDIYSSGIIIGPTNDDIVGAFSSNTTAPTAATNCFNYGTSTLGAICTNMSADDTNIANYTGISNEFIDDPLGGSPVFKVWNTYKTLGSYKLGSRNDPFILYTPAQWNAIGYLPELMDKSFMLGADIDFTFDNFRPIGTTFSPFRGQFRGNNYALMNITLDETGGSDLNFDGIVDSTVIDYSPMDGTPDTAENAISEPLGVFRILGGLASYNGARIEDEDQSTHSGKWFYLSNVNLTSSDNAASSVGILAGLLDDVGTANYEAVRIAKVKVIGGSSSAAGTTPSGVGGVIGQVSIDNVNTELRKIESSASISSCNGVGVGGIFGNMIQPTGTIPTDTVRIQDMKYFGDIYCPTTDNVGGIAGNTNSDAFAFQNLVNTANIVGNNNVGGLFGTLKSNISAGKNIGDIDGNDMVAGLAGSVDGSTGSASITASYTDYNFVSSTANAGAITANCVTCTLSNNLANAYNVSGATTSYFAIGTFSGNSNLYTGLVDESLTGATFVDESMLYDYATTNTLSGGLVDSPWTQPPGSFPMLHFERWPQFFEN